MNILFLKTFKNKSHLSVDAQFLGCLLKEKNKYKFSVKKLMVLGTVLLLKAVPKTLSEFLFQFSFFYHWSIFSSEQINKEWPVFRTSFNAFQTIFKESCRRLSESRNKLPEAGSVRVAKINRYGKCFQRGKLILRFLISPQKDT